MSLFQAFSQVTGYSAEYLGTYLWTTKNLLKLIQMNIKVFFLVLNFWVLGNFDSNEFSWCLFQVSSLPAFPQTQTSKDFHLPLLNFRGWRLKIQKSEQREIKSRVYTIGGWKFTFYPRIFYGFCQDFGTLVLNKYKSWSYYRRERSKDRRMEISTDFL